jgi:hypothetical protein
MWIAWSALGGTALALFALVLYIPADRSFASELLMLVVGFAVAVAAGVALLPAVRALQPR